MKWTVLNRVPSTVEAVFVARYEGGELPAWLDAAARKRCADASRAKQFKGARGEMAVVCSGSAPIVFVGMGKEKDKSYERVRRFAAAAYRKSTAEKWTRVAIDFDSTGYSRDGYAVQGAVEGWQLSAYRFDSYKSKKNSNPFKIESVVLVALAKADAAAARDGVRDGVIVSEGVAFARDLGNEPANVLYPESYAARLRAQFAGTGVRVTVLDPKKLKGLRMGGILGVGQGSRRGPRLVILEYKPLRSQNDQPIALVGKGVTFDTGGISIKPAKSMEDMKFDMCGSAAVAAAIWTAARLKLPVWTVGFLPMVENMPGGMAQRPGDIIRCHNGKTVEVLNTDAEGRLILADALAYSARWKPKYVVDAATLTGACAHTLDYVASGLMTNDPALGEKLKAAGERAGERLWEFPLWEEYDEFIKGTSADIQNISRKTAGIQTSGMFLKHFADHSKWAHLDIAGTAYTAGPRDYYTTGATGVATRLFLEFLKRHG